MSREVGLYSYGAGMFVGMCVGIKAITYTYIENRKG